MAFQDVVRLLLEARADKDTCVAIPIVARSDSLRLTLQQASKCILYIYIYIIYTHSCRVLPLYVCKHVCM